MNDIIKHQMKKKQNDQTDKLQKQIEEWKSKYLRALADYQNLEKRVVQEKTEVRVYAAEAVLTKLLPIVDTFERAQTHLSDTGLSLAFKELGAFFASQGVSKLEVVGKPFDPSCMECIEVVEGVDTIVVEETLPGYTLHGKMIRVAQVKVGRTEESTNDKPARQASPGDAGGSTNKQMNDTINQ